jgi:hypothetical protein
MKKEFIQFLEEKGWKLISDQNNIYKFDRTGPLAVYFTNSTIELFRFNTQKIEGVPYMTLVTSFTGLESLSYTSFVHLMYVMGIAEPKRESNARVIGDLVVDAAGHCKPSQTSLS